MLFKLEPDYAFKTTKLKNGTTNRGTKNQMWPFQDVGTLLLNSCSHFLYGHHTDVGFPSLRVGHITQE